MRHCGPQEQGEGAKKGRFEQLADRGSKGWRASGSALSIRGRSADAVVLGVQNDEGEWIAVAAGTPISPPLLRALESTHRPSPHDKNKRDPMKISLPASPLNRSHKRSCSRSQPLRLARFSPPALER